MVQAKLTTEQVAIKNADQFRHRLNILNRAAVGVVLIRTSEPYRAIETIREMAYAEKVACGLWTITQGWGKYNLTEPSAAVKYDGVMDPVAALRAMAGDGTNANKGFENGFWMMMYPHFWLKSGQPNPIIIQLLKEACRLYTQDDRRLMLIVPQAASLPMELEQDVAIMDFDTPSYSEMRSLYNETISFYEAKAPRFTESEVERIIAAAAGMTQHEFESALSRAVVENRHMLPNVPIQNIVDGVMNAKIEVVKRSEVLEVMAADNMANVGGLENLKDWLTKRSACFSQEAKDFGIETPKGIALIGPPGTGKSLVGKATASLLGLPLIKFDVSRVFQSLVGQSEERVRSALKMLDAMAPCVVFLDEVDKAFQIGSGGDSGVSQRVLGLILTHMQETKHPIFWVASANRVDNLPSEFLRRGRLDEVFSVTLPDETERMEILKIHLRKRGFDPAKVEGLDVAVSRSSGYVPAEIEAAVKDSIIEAFHSKSEPTGAMIGEQLSNMKPLSEAFAEQFARMREWAENNARPASKATAVAPVATRTRRVASAAAPAAGRSLNLDS